MRQRILKMAVSVVFVLAWVAGAYGQQNAADVYWKAQEQMADVSMEDVAAMQRAIANPAGQMPESVQRLVSSHWEARSTLIRAASMRYCDFGLGPHITPTTYVPHLRIMHGGYMLLLADSMLSLANQDYDGAIKSIEAVYGMANHLRGDRFETSSSTARWMIINADRMLAHAQGIGGLDPARAAGVARALGAFDRRDPTGVADTAASMVDQAVRWYEDMYDAGETGHLESYLSMFDGENTPDLDDVEPEEFYGALDTGAAVLDKAVDVLVAIDGKEEQEQAIRQVLESLDKESLAARFFPWRENLTTLPWCLHKARQLVEERLAIMNAIAQGEIGAKETANAAFWYVKGADALAQIPLEHWDEVVEAFGQAGQSSQADAGEHAARMKQAEEAIKLFEEGAGIDNCDFTAVRRDSVGRVHVLHLAPDYVRGIWEALELFHARAGAAIEAGDLEKAADDLCVCFRMIAHLAGDEVITSSAAAHHGFRGTLELCETILKHPDMEEQQKMRIAGAFGGIHPADPFGHARSLLATRKDLPVRLSRVIDAPPGENMRTLLTEALGGWSDDQLLCGVMIRGMYPAEPIVGETNEDDAPIGESESDPRADRFLNSTLGEDYIKGLQADAFLIVNLLEAGDLESIARWPASDPSPLNALRRGARKELRAAQKVLLPKVKADQAAGGDEAAGASGE